MIKRTQTLGILRSEGFESAMIRTWEEETGERSRLVTDEQVTFIADMDCDHDGANGQHDLPWAYRKDDQGSDYLANVGYPHNPSQYRDALICDVRGVPILFHDLYFASLTSLRMPLIADRNNPRIAVDSAFYPYTVIPNVIRTGTRGKCLGCRCTVEHLKTGKVVEAVVADMGPSKKNGEGSIALCQELGISANRRGGGEDRAIFRYTLFPGVPALVKGTQFVLQ